MALIVEPEAFTVARVLAFPFRLDRTGRIATVEQDSEDDIAQQLAMLILTRPEERPLTPGYGTPDPAFEGFDPLLLAAAAEEFGPDVEIEDITVLDRGDGTQDVTINFQ
jgi:hypothetical protein